MPSYKSTFFDERTQSPILNLQAAYFGQYRRLRVTSVGKTKSFGFRLLSLIEQVGALHLRLALLLEHQQR
jgi:hypothetical protein